MEQRRARGLQTSDRPGDPCRAVGLASSACSSASSRFPLPCRGSCGAFQAHLLPCASSRGRQTLAASGASRWSRRPSGTSGPAGTVAARGPFCGARPAGLVADRCAGPPVSPPGLEAAASRGLAVADPCQRTPGPC